MKSARFKILFFILFAASLGAQSMTGWIPKSCAEPADPTLIPPEVTIPYTVPPNSVPPIPINQSPAFINGNYFNGNYSNGNCSSSNPSVGNYFGSPYSHRPPDLHPTDNKKANPEAGLSQTLNSLYRTSAIPGLAGINSHPPGTAFSSVIPGSSYTVNASKIYNPTDNDCPGCLQHRANQHAPNLTALPSAGTPGNTAPKTTISHKDPLATINTTKGAIVIRLFRQLAPHTVANFVDLSNKAFYNGLRWHRVVPGFCIQTGCPKGDGTGCYIDPVSKQPRYLPLEISPQLRHNTAGVVAMARFGSDYNSASSQFYITLSPQPHLDDKYAVFGGVINGLDVVKHITTADKVLSISVQEQE